MKILVTLKCMSQGVPALFWCLYNSIINAVYKIVILNICIFQLARVLLSYFYVFITCKLIINNNTFYIDLCLHTYLSITPIKAVWCIYVSIRNITWFAPLCESSIAYSILGNTFQWNFNRYFWFLKKMKMLPAKLRQFCSCLNMLRLNIE